jgi:hypothetical protein
VYAIRPLAVRSRLAPGPVDSWQTLRLEGDRTTFRRTLLSFKRSGGEQPVESVPQRRVASHRRVDRAGGDVRAGLQTVAVVRYRTLRRPSQAANDGFDYRRSLARTTKPSARGASSSEVVAVVRHGRPASEQPVVAHRSGSTARAVVLVNFGDLLRPERQSLVPGGSLR